MLFTHNTQVTKCDSPDIQILNCELSFHIVYYSLHWSYLHYIILPINCVIKSNVLSETKWYMLLALASHKINLINLALILPIETSVNNTTSDVDITHLIGFLYPHVLWQCFFCEYEVAQIRSWE